MNVENAIFKSKGEESTEVLEQTKLRDVSYEKYLAVSKKVLDACNSGSGLIGRFHEENKATKARADRLIQLLEESVDCQSNVASRLECAAREAISELHSDSMSFDVLISAAADAKMVVECKYGAEPHERVKRDLKEMILSIRNVRRAVRNAQQKKEDAVEDRDDEQRAHWEQKLSHENEKLRTLQQTELILWSDVYRLVADEKQRLKEQDELARRAQSRQAQLQREQEELERKERELADQGKLNRDEQKKVHGERQRLEAERTKISEEKKKCEKDLQKQQQKLDQKMREEDAQLKSEKKKIEGRKRELEKKEREASKGLQVPPYWKNKSGVATKFVRDALQKFMVESSCCNATKQTRVVSVERVENESLWKMYQLRRDILKKTYAAQHIQSLSTATKWQPEIPSKAELSTNVNEFYLFHGTGSRSAQIICSHGFDERVANLKGLYGAGSYFASNSCKSHQHSNTYKDSPTWVMLVCRVVMGTPYCTSTLQGHIKQRRPPDNAATPGRPFDSIFAQHGIAHGGNQQHKRVRGFRSTTGLSRIHCAIHSVKGPVASRLRA
jgi:hypothetical protein